MSGWIKLHRQLQENSLWLSEPFSRGQAWVDLMMLANHKQGFVRVRGQRIDVGVGCVARAQKTLAERWKWSKGKVVRFLKELESDGQIEQQTSHDFNVIRLCNYEEYQTDGSRDRSRDEPETGHEIGPEIGHETGHIQEQQKQQEGKEVRAKRPPKFKPPLWIPEDAWAGYIASRRSMKKHPMSDSALESVVKAIEKCVDAGHSVETALEAMTSNGWRTVKADWLKRAQGVPTGIRDNSALAAKVAAEMEQEIANAT